MELRFWKESFFCSNIELGGLTSAHSFIQVVFVLKTQAENAHFWKRAFSSYLANFQLVLDPHQTHYLILEGKIKPNIQECFNENKPPKSYFFPNKQLTDFSEQGLEWKQAF